MSPDKPVFEFAKRTYNSGLDVSPVPFKSLINSSLADIVGITLQYSRKKLITGASVFKRLVSRFGNPTRKELVMPILAILGALVSQKQLPHRWLVESLVDPKDEDFDLEESNLEIPQVSSIKLILETLEGNAPTYPFSQQEVRSELFDDYEDEFANVVANKALLLARRLEQDYDSIMDIVSSKVAPIKLDLDVAKLCLLEDPEGTVASRLERAEDLVKDWTGDVEIQSSLRLIKAQVSGFVEENFLN